jgi:hypothetical protein
MRKDACHLFAATAAVVLIVVTIGAARPATASACAWTQVAPGVFRCVTHQQLDPPCPSHAEGATTYQFANFLPIWGGGIANALLLGDGMTLIGPGASPCPDSEAEVIIVTDPVFAPPPGEQADEVDLLVTPGNGAVGGAMPSIVFSSTFGGPAGCFDPDPLAFGSLTAGQSRTLPFTLRSCGVTGLAIGQLHLAPGTNGFLLHDDGCSGRTLSAGTGSCGGSIRFGPGSGGTFTSALIVPVDGPTSTLTLPLTGTGLLAIGPPPPGRPVCPGAGPSVPRPCGDVAVDKQLRSWDGRDYTGDAPGVAVFQRVRYRITVHARGPDDPGAIEIHDALPSAFVVDDVADGGGECAHDLGGLLCAGLHDGSVVDVFGHFVHDEPMENVVTASSESGVPDPDPSNNSASVSSIALDPQAFGDVQSGPNRSVSASGRAASGTERVEVAMLRIGSGRPGATVSKRRTCAWLSGRQGRLRRRPPDATGHCTLGVWQKAKGTRRWRFHVAHVPRGRYLVLVRAVDRHGVAEARFTRSRGNALRLRVR